MEIINATDGYKLGHHRMYPEGTQMVYSNWTPRSNRYFPEATEGSVVFGIQYFVKKYLIEEFNKWFALPKEEAIKQFAYRVGNFVDLNQVFADDGLLAFVRPAPPADVLALQVYDGVNAIQQTRQGCAVPAVPHHAPGAVAPLARTA